MICETFELRFTYRSALDLEEQFIVVLILDLYVQVCGLPILLRLRFSLKDLEVSTHCPNRTQTWGI